MSLPDLRIHTANQAPMRPRGDFVLYWMTAARRIPWNYALDRAVDLALELQRPLLILEALRSDYPWASDRLHRFILDGMEDNRRELHDAPARYYPYVEDAPGAGKGLLQALSRQACIVVTDLFPAFFLPSMTAAAAGQSAVRLEQVDGNGVIALDDTDRAFPTAYAFRRRLQTLLPHRLKERPRSNPFEGVSLPRLRAIPGKIAERWPPAELELLQGDSSRLARLPIDHGVPCTDSRGGSRRAEALLDDFLDHRLQRYAEAHNQPEADVTSRLSPHLHFGHISAHHVVGRVLEKEGWNEKRLAHQATGSRGGWWGVSEGAEAFLDQALTWRELGLNVCRHRSDYQSYSSLPDWARATLKAHAGDPRPHLYDLEAFQNGRTHDPLWNAAQGQLLSEGRIHNYLRMLWGKKILEWAPSPREALEIMLELNDRWALDGRDPNSYTGILWVLGRHDRAWGPERPVFGKVRYMSSENTARKVRVKQYMETFRPPAP